MVHSSDLSALGVVTPGRTVVRAAELGHLLADATVKALSDIEVRDEAKLGAVTMQIGLPLKKYPSLAATARQLQDAESHLAQLVKHDGHDVEQLRRAKSEQLYAS